MIQKKRNIFAPFLKQKLTNVKCIIIRNLNKKMKKSKKNLMLLISLLLMMSMANAEAQMRVGGSIEPDPNAILDLNSNDTNNGTKGLLLPRVALVATTDASPLTMHVKGMYVYNTATANDVLPGAYYNDGTKWIRNGNSEVNVKQLEITINETISTRSMIYHGETTTVSSNLKVLNIEPVFSDEVMALTLFSVNSLAKSNAAGTAVNWSVKVSNANFDSTKSCELQKIIISYVCDDELTTSSLTETYILVGQ